MLPGKYPILALPASLGVMAWASCTILVKNCWKIYWVAPRRGSSCVCTCTCTYTCECVYTCACICSMRRAFGLPVFDVFMWGCGVWCSGNTLSPHGVNPKVAIQNSSDDRPGNGSSGVLDSLYCSQPFPPSLDFWGKNYGISSSG